MEILEKYGQEIAEDTAVDEINVKDVAMRLPGIKHKWVARLINHKRQLNRLDKEKEAVIEATLKKIKEKGDIQLSKSAMTAKISTLESVKVLDEKIDAQKALVDYLEHVESIFRYMTNDIKNVIDIMKMELT
jgi:hypothetical protein